MANNLNISLSLRPLLRLLLLKTTTVALWTCLFNGRSILMNYLPHIIDDIIIRHALSTTNEERLYWKIHHEPGGAVVYERISLSIIKKNCIHGSSAIFHRTLVNPTILLISVHVNQPNSGEAIHLWRGCRDDMEPSTRWRNHPVATLRNDLINIG